MWLLSGLLVMNKSGLRPVGNFSRVQVRTVHRASHAVTADGRHRPNLSGPAGQSGQCVSGMEPILIKGFDLTRQAIPM